MNGVLWTKEQDAQLRKLRERGSRKQKQQPAMHWDGAIVIDGIGAPVALLDLEPHHCRWPVRDAPYAFCANTKADHSSYCSRHFGISKRI